MSAVKALNRRGFLKVSTAATGGLLIGFYLPGKGELAAQSGSVPESWRRHDPPIGS